MFYDIELVDVSDNVENFKFNRVSQEMVDKVIGAFKDNSLFLELSSEQGAILLERKGFRGIMYNTHEAPPKSVAQENSEDAVEVSKVVFHRKNIKGD